VFTRGRDLDGAFDVRLAFDLREIDVGRGRWPIAKGSRSRQFALAPEEEHDFRQGRRADDLKPLHHGRFVGILGGQHQRAPAPTPRFQGNR
jgi:hypothetical protein